MEIFIGIALLCHAASSIFQGIAFFLAYRSTERKKESQEKMHKELMTSVKTEMREFLKEHMESSHDIN